MVKHYSDQNTPKFLDLLKVPDRIPDLAKQIPLKSLGAIVMAELTLFVNAFTVVRPMNADQIAQCAYALINTAEEDYLSLQDLVMFFEGAKQGKYGKVYDRLDQATIFEMLEVYRQQRHEVYLRAKEEKEAQYSTSRTALPRKDDSEEKQSMRDAMIDYYKKTLSKSEETK